MTKPRSHEPLPADESAAALAAALAGLGAEVGEGLRMLAELHPGKAGRLLHAAELAEYAGGQQPGDGHTGEIVVRIFPAGRPGFGRYTVTSTGPVTLSAPEQARALRAAAASLAEDPGGHATG